MARGSTEKFRYIALDAAGHVQQGVMPAPDSASARSRLEARALTPVRVDPVGGFSIVDILNKDVTFGAAMNRGETAIFFDSLGSLLDAGLNLDDALVTLAEIQRGQAARELISGLVDLVREGQALSDALATEPGVFPSELIAIVRAGEESGRLSAVLVESADYLSRANALRQKIKASLYYPAFLIVMAITAVIIVVTLVLPEFEPIFASAGQELPLLTRIVRAFGIGLVDYYWVILLVILALVMASVYIRRDPRLRLRRDKRLLGMPIFGQLVLIGQSAMLARVLGSLLRGGVGIVRALDIAGGTLSNKALAVALEGVGDKVKRGEKLGQALSAAEIFPDLFVRLTRVGDEAGRLDEMLLKVAGIYDDHLRIATDRLVAILVPVITLVMGLVVAVIVFAVLSAVLGLNHLI